MAWIGNQYNQAPHLSQDTKWENNKITINMTNKSQEARPFTAGDHKAARTASKAPQTQDIKTQMIHKRSTALEWLVKIFYWGGGGLKTVSWRQPYP